jgi:preprotein translocase subunit YajC
MEHLILAQATGGGDFMTMLLPFGLMFLLLYLLIMRPQHKKEKERLVMLQNVKKDDHVLTSGGIYGVVQLVKDNEVMLKIDETGNVKVRVAKSAIIGIEKSSDKIS